MISITSTLRVKYLWAHYIDKSDILKLWIIQNKESALRILRARMLAAAQEEAERIASAERKNQVRTVDRSERIRTYNFPENRLSDHRVNYKANNLDSVMNGDLEAVIQSLIDADRTAKLSAGNS